MLAGAHEQCCNIPVQSWKDISSRSWLLSEDDDSLPVGCTLSEKTNLLGAPRRILVMLHSVFCEGTRAESGSSDIQSGAIEGEQNQVFT